MYTSLCYGHDNLKQTCLSRQHGVSDFRPRGALRRIFNITVQSLQNGNWGGVMMQVVSRALAWIKRNRIVKRWGPTLAFLLVAFMVSYYFMERRYFLNEEYYRAPLESLVQGVAVKPFQFRVLIPWMVKITDALLQKVGFVVSARNLFKVFEIISTFWLIVVCRYYLSLFFKGPILYVLPFTLLLVLPFNFIIGCCGASDAIFPYDIPSILFLFVGLTLIYKRNWVLFYPIFLIATLNKESTFLLTLAFLFTALGKRPAKAIAPHVLTQFVLWFGIKLWLSHLYAHNPGAAFEYHLRANLEDIITGISARPKDLIIGIFSSMGFSWLVPVLFYHRIRDDFIQRTLWVAVPYVAGLMCVAVIIEVRDYGDLIPMTLPATLLIVRQLFHQSAQVGSDM